MPAFNGSSLADHGKAAFPAEPCRLLPLILALVLAAAALADEVVVIVNRENPHAVDPGMLRRIYTGTQKTWPDGGPIQAFDQAEDSEARALFCTRFLGRSAANIRAIWAQNIFTGKGLPPRTLAGDAEMRRAVAASRNAIGYIRASSLDASVKAAAN